jgi:hypothetical protein
MLAKAVASEARQTPVNLGWLLLLKGKGLCDV